MKTRMAVALAALFATAVTPTVAFAGGEENAASLFKMARGISRVLLPIRVLQINSGLTEVAKEHGCTFFTEDGQPRWDPVCTGNAVVEKQEVGRVLRIFLGLD